MEKGIHLGKSWDKIADIWDENFGPLFKKGLVWGPYGPYEDKIKLLSSVKNKKVLVLGCGSAPDVIWLAKHGALVTGVDISGNQLALAKEKLSSMKLSATLIQADLDKMPLRQFKKESFDLIISNYAFQYVKRLDRLYSKIHVWLKPKGQLVFSLDHPVLYATYQAHQKKKRVRDFKTFDYLNERTLFWHFRFHNGVPAYSYHRTLGSLQNPLIDTGFEIKKVIEPKPSAKSSKDYHKSFEFAKRVPYTIIISATKK